VVKGAFTGRTYDLPFERAFVAMIDDAPLANWGHPCRYVFVKDDLSSFVVWYAIEPMAVSRDGLAVELKVVSANVSLPKEPGLDEVRKAVQAVVGKDAEKGVACRNGDTSHSYAVLISGGANSLNNHTRYWGDMAAMYATLTRRYGIPKENIVILMSDGTSTSIDISTNGSSHGYFANRTSPQDLDGDTIADVTGSATAASVREEFAALKAKLTDQDQLFVFVTDHGGKNDAGSSYVCLWNSTMYVSDFAEMTSEMTCPVLFAFEFCYSGAFIGALTNQAGVRAVATAASVQTSSAWSKTSSVTGIGSNPGLFYMDPWVYYFVGATSGVFPSVTLSPWNDDVACTGADTSGDGRISFKEASDYAKKCIKADKYEETPNYGESSSGVGESLYLVKGTPTTGTGNLAYLTVSGQDECVNGESATYSCKARMDDGTEKTVTPTWTVVNGFSSSIQSSGTLSVSGVSGTCLVTVQATYSEGGITKTVTKQVISGVRPANDDFANATEISGISGTLISSSELATYETGEPLKKFSSSATRSVWWVWTAPSTGIEMQIDTIGTGFDTVMGIYTGNSVGSLTLIKCDDDGGGDRTSKCTFTTTEGTRYYIVVAGYNGRTGMINLNWKQSGTVVRPANDDFANATVISGTTGKLTSSSQLATYEEGEPLASYRLSASNSVWWVWTAPSDEVMQFDTIGSNFDTVMGVYTGTALKSLGLVARDDDGGGDSTSKCLFKAYGGTRYYIAVAGYYGKTGNITLNWKQLGADDCQSNDDFANATVISGASGALTNSNVNATLETGEPILSFSSNATASIWWSWTAPETGNAQFDTNGTSFDTVMGVYTGTAFDRMTVIAENDDGGSDSQTSKCTFKANKGVRYWIAVAGYNGKTGAVILNWSFSAYAVQLPPNDDFSAALVISGYAGQSVSTNTYATYEYGEPLKQLGTAATNTVWWTWTAPTTGSVVFETVESNFDTEMGVYTGTALSSLTTVCADKDSGKSYGSICSFNCTEGTQYYIAVGGYAGKSGVIKLNWLCQYPRGFKAADTGKFGLFVGIDKYVLSGCLDLSCCSVDFAAMEETWSEYCDVLPEENAARGNWNILYDQYATKAQVRASLAKLAETANAGDEVLFYQSSHGGISNASHTVYLCMYDARYWDYELAEDLARFKSGVRLVIVVDACHSGGLFKSVTASDKDKDAKETRPAFDLPARVSELMRQIAKSRVTNDAGEKLITPEEIGWIAAADYDQSSLGGSKGSEFTMAMISAWRDDKASADSNSDLRLDFYELFKAAETVGASHGAIGQCANENVLKSATARTYPGYVPKIVIDSPDAGDVKIPISWFASGEADGVQLFDPDKFAARFGTDYAAAATKLTGKVDAQGNPMTVWQDFIAGTDPTDPTSVFTAEVTFENGQPVVTWTPDLNNGGTRSVRSYQTLGLQDMKDMNNPSAWKVVEPGTENQYRFFKVEVMLP